MFYCQIGLIVLLFGSFMATVKVDFNGRQAKPAEGFSGFISTCISFILYFALSFGAGSFSLLTEFVKGIL